MMTIVGAERDLERLTERQRDVLALVARGLTNKDIALVLGISPETARTHVAAILGTLGAANRAEAAAAHVAWTSSPGRAAAVLARPAIAVLPIATAGGRNAGLVAAAIGRELTALLSRWCYFPVIAHTATRDPRSLGDTTAAIGAALGARFLVDGALQCTRARWRLAVSVADARTGHVVWSDHHDVAPRRWFALQDEVCATIVAQVYPRLIAAVHAGLPRVTPPDLEAWQVAHQALVHHEARDRAANQLARDGFTAALGRDPSLLLAHFGRGLAAYDEIVNQWGPPDAALDRLARDAERCQQLAPDHAEGLFLTARSLQARGRHDRAQPPLRAAIAANPSFAPAYAVLAQVLLLTGDRDEGLARMHQACRLDPRSFVAGLAVAHFARGEYREAREAAERAVAGNPRYPFARALAAACAWWSDDLEGAARHVDALRAIGGDFTPDLFARTFGDEVDAVARWRTALEHTRRRQPRSVSAASGPSSPAAPPPATAP